MPFLELESARIHYEDDGFGPPLILLHSYFGSTQFWNPQRAALRDHYRLVVPDLRGHGHSTYDGGRLRLSDMVADIVSLIEHLGVAPAHLVGSSLGAQIGLVLARDQANMVRTLVAVGPPHLREASCRAFMTQIINEQLLDERGRWSQPHASQGDDHLQSVLAPNFARDRDEPPQDQLNAVDRAGAIARPTLIVAGDNDPVFPLRRALELAERIVDSELCVLPRAGHFPNRADPDVFNRVLLGFLRRHA